MAQWLLHPITHSPINLFILLLLIPHSLPAADAISIPQWVGPTALWMTRNPLKPVSGTNCNIAGLTL